MWFPSIIVFSLAIQLSTSFQPAVHFLSRSSALYLIEAETEDDLDVDVGLGGVRLAKESTIVLEGTVKFKPGSAKPEISELVRYNKLTPVDEDLVSKSVTVIGTGIGNENYADPGTTTNKKVEYAPDAAVKDALVGMGSAQDFSKVVVNFSGGDDLQVLEVMGAIEQLILGMDCQTKTKIFFNSASDSAWPLAQAGVTVVGINNVASTDDGEGAAVRSEIEKALAGGQVYFRDGKYLTLVDGDKNEALA